MNISRSTYFTLVTDPIKQYFQASVPAINDEMWFETDSRIPLKWHIPVGVLYDLYGNEELPWSLIVHFQSFPTARLLRCPNIQTIQSHFNNSVKEANYLKHGDIKKINTLSLQESENLWQGLINNGFTLFWKSNELLTADKEQMKSVPVRVCRQDRPFTQDPVPAMDTATGREMTLGAFLKSKFPELVKETATKDNYVTDCAVIVQGVRPPLNTPLVWLANNLSHPDNFVYISLVPTQK
jgi:autophagy-related protein 5